MNVVGLNAVGVRLLRAGVLSASVLLLMMMVSPLRAQPEPTPALREYRIPPGPLGAALAKLAAEAGVLFSVDARLLDARTTPGLQGRYALPQAFAQLLAGTGLELVQEGPRYSLRPAPAPAPPAVRTSAAAAAPARPVPTTALPPLTVRAAAPGGEPRYASPSAPGLARSDAPAQELPQSLTVLTQDVIQDLAVGSIAEVLRYVPGIGAAQGEGNRDTPVFRGRSSTSSFLVDGLRDDMPYYRDLYNVERVEALRGPNATMVGHGAVAGLINRVSKLPDWSERRTGTFATHSGGQQRVTLDAAQTHGADSVDGEHGADGTQFASRLNLLYEEAGSYRDYFRLRRVGVNPVLGWRLPGRALLTLGFEHFQDQRTDDRGVPSYDGRPLATRPGTFFGNPNESRTGVRLNALNAQLELDLGASRRLRSRLRHADYERYFQNVFPGSVRQHAGRLEVALRAHNSRMRRQNTASQTDLTLPWRWGGMAHTVLMGVELARQASDNRRETGFFGADPANTTPGTTLYVPVSQPTSFAPLDFRQRPGDPDSTSQASVLALYLQDEVRLAPGWQATLGLRHDRLAVDMRDHAPRRQLASRDRLWSPRAALRWQPLATLSLYASTSVGYAPRAGEQLSSLTPANQALRPEQFVNHELGAKWQPRPGLEATAALYRLDRRNVSILDAATATQVLIDGQRTHGLELGLAGRLRPGWQVMGAYAWQDSRVRAAQSAAVPAGAVMPHVPRHSLSLWNRVALNPRWAVGLGASWRGMVFASTDNSVRLPGYARVDAALFHNLDDLMRGLQMRGLQLQLNVENLFDRRYAAFAHSNNNITPGAPRTLKLMLSATF